MLKAVYRAYLYTVSNKSKIAAKMAERESEHRSDGQEHMVEVEAERLASNSCVVFLKSEALREDSIMVTDGLKKFQLNLSHSGFSSTVSPM